MEQLEMNYPPELPVCEHRTEILDALRRHPVVIVCGDTGSGKTTQLPKMALERRRRIAVTQPRRLAAVTMAERVAEELKCEIGGLVGFRHRFGRKVSSETRIEFMTDGVLLAETRFDPLLRAYDTIIVDEAHERSLNIDFLLGILKRILERRRDLKVIVSSATLDAAHFSGFFGDAPVISVPGRLYPIEIGYRPPPEDEERDLPRDVAAAVAELPAKDDILVFLPGERDIRETADYLTDVRGGYDDIIPLLASLPASEQRRAFQSSPRRRIILATNVAETSVTIPGIRAVIDSGLARISRYIHRTQVQRLQIEPISQASAKQRTGRCGRLGPGICLRLYSEEDFNSRDAYTAPEVLRSSLAGVILTMLDLKLGDIEKFPFLDPPKPTMIREGLRELLELGAIQHTQPYPQRPRCEALAYAAGREGAPRTISLTEIGQKLAKIPVEPRLARMLLAGSRNAVLPSVIPLVAAMSCDDPRRRPIDEKEKADQAHAKFRVLGSDFLGTLKLWQWWSDETRELSQSKARKLCKTNYLSYPKMREWRDLTHQLEGLSKKLGLSFTVPDASRVAGAGQPDADFSARLHMSLLSGLLGRIGRYDEEERDYRGAHGLRFALHPSSVLAKKDKRDKRDERDKSRSNNRTIKQSNNSPVWIVAGELVDTSRLFARDAAVIDVRWLEPVAGAICKHSYHSPEWDPRSGFVRATEQVTLYELVIVPARRCDFSRIDPVVSREVFIRRGLIDGEFPKPPPAVRANQQLLEALRRRAERSRHPEFFDEDRLFAYFDKVIPKDICSADALRKWLRTVPDAPSRRGAGSPDTVTMPRSEGAAGTVTDFVLKKSDWWPSDTAADRDFPDSLRIAGKTLLLTYRHTPDDPENDGVTCTVRRSDTSVLRLWRSDWLVPGLLPEKLLWMLGTLPSALRRILTPLDDSVAILLSMLKPGSDSLENAVRAAVNERWALRIPENAWDWSRLPSHLQMRFRIRDDATGKTLVLSRDLDETLATVLSPPSATASGRGSIANASRRDGDGTVQTWIFGSVPVQQTDRNSGWATVSYPALRDEGDGVALNLYADPAKAAEAHAAGVTRLFTLALSSQLKIPFRLRTVPAAPSLRGVDTLDAALYLKDIGYEDDRIAADMLAGAIRETLVRNRPEVRTAEEFEKRLAEDRSVIVKTQAEMTAILIESAATATKLHGLMEDERIPEETKDSVSEQIAWLLFRGFLRTVPLATLRHYKRYLKGAQIRLERARLGPAADLKKEVLFAPYWAQYREAAKPEYAAQVNSAALTDYRWMLEEYRVSLFAQELHTPEPVSPKRLDAKWATV